MTHRCWAEIDLQALRENLAWIRHQVGAGVKIVTVVKADAYGHGLKDIARLLMQSGTDVFGVANLAEAEAIRQVGRGWPVLMLGACLPEEVEAAVRDDVMPTVSSLAEGRLFSAAAVRQRKTVGLHLKVDTGMGRLGTAPDEALALIRRIARLPAISIRGLMTHYSSAEDDAPFSAAQSRKFRALVAAARPLCPDLEFIHANASAALLLHPETTFTAVRPGLLVYGIAPEGRRPLPRLLKRRLRPALSWKCKVSLVRELSAGASVSYGHTYRAQARRRVAVATAGYGDGYLRAGSGRAQVLIRGRRCPVLGRVTMDQMVVDVTRAGAVKAGDEVTLLGRQGRREITASELAAWCRTIPWEILTNIAYRVRRVYRGSHAS